MDFIGQNLPPVLFLTFLVVCALMIIAGAVLDWLPEREPKAAADDDEAKTSSRLSKAEKKKAQAEAKARKKEEQARKKAEKAAAKGKKGKKGKSQEEPAPVAADEAEAPSEPAGETIDFSMPEQE